MYLKISWFKKRKAMSSILGTLIFISIIFSAIVPMTMVMKQADTIYEQEVSERKTLDEEKANEELEVYAWPPLDDSAEIKVFIQNMGYLESKILRIWINEDKYDTNDLLSINNPNVTKVYPVDVTEGVFEVKVVTEKGNIFYNLGEPVEWDFAEQTWFTPSLAITVVIMNDKGLYRINITEVGTEILVGHYESQGTEFEDILQTFLVTQPIIYKVIAQKKTGGGWKDIPGTPINVPKEISDWYKSPVKYVFIDGMELS
jgi:flagellin-like protein